MNKLALLLVACLAALTAFAADVPYLSGRVVDNAEILGAETKRKLTEQLKAHEAETTNQIAVLTVPSLEGESVEAAGTQSGAIGSSPRVRGTPQLAGPMAQAWRFIPAWGHVSFWHSIHDRWNPFPSF